MKICISADSIKLFSSYFKNFIPESLENSDSYEQFINSIFNQAVNDLSKKESAGNDRSIILQHLSIVPQLAMYYKASQAGGVDISNEFNNKLENAAKIIYEATQSTNKQDLINQIVGLAEIVGISKINVIRLTEEEHFNAFAEPWGRSLVQESLWDPVTGYKENITDPKKKLTVAVQRSILLSDNRQDYKLKLMPYDEALKLDNIDDATDYKDFPDARTQFDAVFVVVNNDNEILRFDAEGNVTEDGKTPLIPIRTTLKAFQKQLEHKAGKISSQESIPMDQAMSAVKRELTNHLEQLHNAINKSRTEDVFAEINVTESSKGFIEQNASYPVKLSEIVNMSDIQMQAVQRGGGRVPQIIIPLAEQAYHNIHPIPLSDISQKQKDILFELIFNNNLTINNEKIDQKTRTTLLYNFIQANNYSSDRPLFFIEEFGKAASTSGEIRKIRIGNKIINIPEGNKTKTEAGRKYNAAEIQQAKQELTDALDALFKNEYDILIKQVPEGTEVLDSEKDVTRAGQYFKGENDQIFLRLKPAMSFGIRSSYSNTSPLGTLVPSVTEINGNELSVKEITLRDHIIANSFTVAQPTQTPAGPILRGHGAYIAFDLINDLSTPDVDEGIIPLFRSIAESNKQFAKSKKEQEEQTILDKAAEEWYNNHPIAKVLKTPNITNQVSEKGPSYVASFLKDTINLYAGSSKTDLYHEVFHAYFDGILNKAEQKAIYNELRLNKGSFTVTVLAEEKTIKFSEATPLELEEYLAEEFRLYAQNRSKFNRQPKSKIAQFFKKLLDMLKSLFGNRTSNELIYLNHMGPIVNAAFKDLYEGNIEAAKFEPVLDSSEKYRSYEAEEDLNLSTQEVYDVMTSIESLMSEWVRAVLNTTQNNERKGKLAWYFSKLATLKPTSKTYQEDAKEINKQITKLQEGQHTNGYGIHQIGSNPRILKAALDYARDILNQKLQIYSQDTTSPIAKENVEVLTKVLKKFGDTEKSFEEFENDNSTVIGVFLNNYSNINLQDFSDPENIEVDEFEEELENSLEKRLVFGGDGSEFSIADSASSITQQLLSSIISYTKEGKGTPELNRFGIGRLLPYKVAIGKAAKITKGLTNPIEMYNALLEASKTDNEIKQILNMLGDYNAPGKKDVEWKQWVAFWQDLFKSNQEIVTVRLTKVDNKPVYREGATDEEKKAAILASGDAKYEIKVGKNQQDNFNARREWAGNFKSSLDKPSYIVIDDALDVLNLVEVFGPLSKTDLQNKSDKTIREIAALREIEDYEILSRDEIVTKLTTKPRAKVNGVNRTLSSLNANPFPFLKALGITLPETDEVRDMLIDGNDSAGIPPKIVQEIYNGLKNRERAVKKDHLKVTDFYSLFGAYRYNVTDLNNSEKQITELSNSRSGYVKHLSQIADMFSDVNISFMGRNANGDLMSTRPFHSSLTLAATTLNNANHIDEVINIPGMEYFDYTKNPQIAASTWFVQMFNLDKQGGQQGVRDHDIKIDIKTLGGSIVSYGNEEKGIVSVSSDKKTKYISDFHLTLEGKQEIFRTEAKSTSLTVSVPIKVGGIKRSRVVIDNTDVSKIFSDDYSKLSTRQSLLLYNQFVGHIEAELVRISRVQEIKERLLSGEQIEFDPDFLERGDKFIMFESILSDKLQEKLKSKNVTESFTLKGLLTPEEKREIENSLIAYFGDRANKEFENYDQDLTIADSLIDEYTLDEDESVEDTRKRMHQVFIINNFLNNANFAASFVGDLANYDIVGENFHKRIAGLISAGKMFMHDQVWYDYVNEESFNAKGLTNKYITEQNAQGRNLTLQPSLYKGYINTGVMKEAAFDSAYKPYYDEFFKETLENKSVKELKDLAKENNIEFAKNIKKADLIKKLIFETAAYEEMKEADGAAYITLDMYRVLARSSNDWSIEQERIYQAILNNEDIDVFEILETFPIKKYQYYGMVRNDNAFENVNLAATAFHKYSLMPLIPGVIDGTNLEKLNNRMMEEGIDYVTFESGSKLASLKKLTPDVKSTQADNIYTENRKISNIDDVSITVNQIHVRYLKNQVSVNANFKSKVTLWSQMRSIASLGLSDNGIPSDFEGTREEWFKLNSSEKWQASKFYRLNQNIYNSLAKMQVHLKNELLEDLGLRVETELDEDGNTITKYIGDKKNIGRYIKSNLKQQDLLPDEIDFLFKSNGELIDDLSLSLHAEKLNRLISTMVDKKLRRIKINGEGLTQVSGAMWESSTEDMESDIETGTNSLRFYHLKDEEGNVVTSKEGNPVIQKMEVAIALQGDFLKLLETKHSDGETIGVKKADGKYDFKLSLDRLNEMIKDKKWLATYENFITITGPRIPTQQENSLEAAVIGKFLHPYAGPIIVLPAEIVAKAGSDFDHDKLFMAFMNLASDNKGNVELYSYNSSLNKQRAELLKDKESINDRIDSIWTTIKDLQKEKSNIRSQFKEIDRQIKEEFKKELKQQKGLRKAWIKLNGRYQAIINKKGRFKNMSQSILDIIANEANENLQSLNDRQEIIFDAIDKRTEELIESTDLVTTDKKKAIKDINAKIRKERAKLEPLQETRDNIKKSLNQTSIKGLENELIQAFVDRITNADNFEALVQNNSVDLFYPLAKDLEEKIKGKYDKYDRGPSQKKQKSVSGTTILDYRYNIKQHQENSVSKRSLGVAAVMSMFHAMFTQMGAVIPGISVKQQKALTFYAKVLENPNNYRQDQVKSAVAFMKDVAAPYIRLKSNKLTVDDKIGINFGSRTNADGKNISVVNGQLVNGYVDAPSDPWIFNIQGNKENSPNLIFMVLAGVPPKTAVYFSSVDLVRKYNEIKSELNGVYSDLTKSPGTSPIIKSKTAGESTIQLILDKAREKIFNDPKIKEVLLKTFGTEEVTLNELNNRITKDFSNDELYDMIDSDNMYTLQQIQALAHYIKIEEMASQLTTFTQFTKFANKAITSLTEASRRRNNISKAKSGVIPSIIPSDWYGDMDYKTNNGLFNNDTFTIDLVSQYFKIRNHENLVRLANKIKVPEQYTSEVVRSHFLNDFISYLFQNSLFSKNTYNGFEIVESPELSVSSELDLDNKVYKYNSVELAKRIAREQEKLGNKFPTNMHFMRYDIELQLAEEELDEIELLLEAARNGDIEALKRLQEYGIEEEELDKIDEEKIFMDKYYYLYDNERKVTTLDGVIKRLALYRSNNNIAMFDYRMGYVSMLKNMVKKHPVLAQQFSLVKDLRSDYDETLKTQNFYLPLKDDPQALRRYKENLKNLQNHELSEVKEFFKNFPTMALFQTGLNRTSKYDLARVGNSDGLYRVIESESGITTEQIAILLDEINLTQTTLDDFISKDIAYLSEFASIFQNLLATDQYKLRNKGVNYIRGAKNLVELNEVLDGGTFNNVRIISDISQLGDDYLLEVEDIFDKNGEVKIDNVNELIKSGFTILNQKILAPETDLQSKLDDLLLTKFGIDNSGSIPRRVALSIGQNEENISIVTADKIREYYGLKDEAMANASTIAIGQATQTKSDRLSSSQTYVNEINKKYPEKLASESTQFKDTDRVWVFGSGLFQKAAEGFEGASKKQKMEKLTEAVKKTFNEYHRPLIEKALSANVASFNVGLASGADQFAIGMILNVGGYVPVVRYTTTGKYVEFVREDLIGTRPLYSNQYDPNDLYDAQFDKPARLNEKFKELMNHPDIEEIKNTVKNAREKELIENNLFQQVKNVIENTIRKKYGTPREIQAIKDELSQDFGRIEVGNDIFSSYVEKALMQIRNEYIIARSKGLGFGIPNVNSKVFQRNQVTISLGKVNEQKLISGGKQSTLLNNKQAKEIGLNPGDIAYTEIDGIKFEVTYHGLKNVEELGGAERVAMSEGLPIRETEQNKIPVQIGDKTYYTMSQQTANFLEGQGGLHWYTFSRVTTEIKKANVESVIEGDIFSLDGIPVITTNLGGVHGAGLAQAAKKKGLIKQGDGDFKATDNVVQLPVKKLWSESMNDNNNMDLLRNSLKKLEIVANDNPTQVYLLPLAGLGHGEGSIDLILPLLVNVVKNNSNIQLVVPSETMDLGRQGTVRKDRTKTNLPTIRTLLSQEFPNFKPTQQQSKVKKSVKKLFEFIPELSQIGTPQQYSAYLNTIVPDGIIVYRGQVAQYNFQEALMDIDIQDYEYYFAPTREEAEYWGEMKLLTEKDIRRYYEDTKSSNISEQFPTVEDAINALSKATIYPAILKKYTEGEVTGWNNKNKYREYIAKAKDIHLLGTKQDIEGFKNFVSTQPQAGKQTSLFDGTEDIDNNDIDNLPDDCAG
jgi:hypothetical protein